MLVLEFLWWLGLASSGCNESMGFPYWCEEEDAGMVMEAYSHAWCNRGLWRKMHDGLSMLFCGAVYDGYHDEGGLGG